MNYREMVLQVDLRRLQMVTLTPEICCNYRDLGLLWFHVASCYWKRTGHPEILWVRQLGPV